MASRFVDTIQVATAALVALAAGVVVYTQGTITVAPNVDPAGGPSQIDFAGPSISLSETGTELLHALNFSCAGSGDILDPFPFCVAQLPSVISGSGVLLGPLDVECANFPTTANLDTYFGKGGIGDESSSGTQVLSANHPLTGTQTLVTVFSGSFIWNAADYLRIISDAQFVAAGTDCRVRGWVKDFYGE